MAVAMIAKTAAAHKPALWKVTFESPYSSSLTGSQISKGEFWSLVRMTSAYYAPFRPSHCRKPYCRCHWGGALSAQGMIERTVSEASTSDKVTIVVAMDY